MCAAGRLADPARAGAHPLAVIGVGAIVDLLLGAAQPYGSLTYPGAIVSSVRPGPWSPGVP
jgi:hypothetical protein